MAALGCDLNRSMQHLHSITREGDVENETTTQDLLQLRTKKLDVDFVDGNEVLVLGVTFGRAF